MRVRKMKMNKLRFTQSAAFILLVAALGWTLPAAQARPGPAQVSAEQKIHIFRADLPGARNRPLDYVQSGGRYAPVAAPAGASSAVAPPAQSLFFPVDVTNFSGTQHLKTAKQFPIFVNCANPTTCWGNVAQFLKDLNVSAFIHILDQYVGSTTNKRYPFGASFPKTVALNHFATDANLQTIIAQVVAANGGNAEYTNLYHIFLKQGQDVCFDTSFSVCYSPDQLSTFAFCGYHSVFNSGGHHIIYSV